MGQSLLFMKNIITASKDPGTRQFLSVKLLQYLSRIYDPRETKQHRLDAFYKAAIIQELMNNGDASLPIIQFKLTSITGNSIDDTLMAEAWKVISDYNETCGRNVAQRTDQTVSV